MNTATPITTAARRIARKANATAPTLAVEFDRQGHAVDVHPAGLRYAPHAAPEGIVLTIHCNGGGLTYRRAQDLLDAVDAHPGDRGMQDYYLQQLETAREMEAVR
ncbi:MAG: hypothetical protein QM628_00170 [Propionicimonas sp.]